MTRVIYLAPGEARCSGAYCQRNRPCARKLAPPELGRPLADYSLPSGTYAPAECSILGGWPKFISLENAVAPKQTKQAKEWIGQ